VLLILDQQPTEFTQKLKTAAEKKGTKTLLLTSEDIANSLSLAFFISNKETDCKFSFRGSEFGKNDIKGCYCAINAFEPELWPAFSPEDAAYAAKETQALWLGILSSLECTIINPPALDTLAGTYLSTPETMNLARDVGFKIPLVITLESGKTTAELLKCVQAKYTDLGEPLLSDRTRTSNSLWAVEQSENHFRITEQISGKSVHLTVIGKKTWACEQNPQTPIRATDISQIPKTIGAKTRMLQKRLNLNCAEYHFQIQNEDEWVFTGISRPPLYSAFVFGEALFSLIVEFALEAGVDSGNTGLRLNH
jgi:hypothetical protein